MPAEPSPAMPCAEVERALDEYCYRLLAADRARALEAHLAGCADCQRRLQARRAALGDLDAAGAAPPALGDRRRTELLDQLTALETRTRRQRGRWGRRCARALGVAVVVLALGAFARALWAPRPLDAAEVLVIGPARLAVTAPASLTLLVRERTSGAPRAGARLTVDLLEIAEGRAVREHALARDLITDARGGALLQRPLPAVAPGRHALRVQLADGVPLTVPVVLHADLELEVAADQPRVEPGGAVSLVARVRRAADHGPASVGSVVLALVDPRGTVVARQEAPAGDLGVAMARFPLAARALEGRWQGWARAGGREARVAFEVEAARVAAVPAELTVGRGRHGAFFTPGESVPLFVRARDAERRPRAGWEVRWAMVAGERPVQEGAGTTDDRGAWEHRLPVEALIDALRAEPAPSAPGAGVPAAASWRAELEVRVRLADARGIERRLRAPLVLADAPLALDVAAADGGRFLAREFPNRFFVTLRAADGRARPAAIVARAGGWEARRDPAAGGTVALDLPAGRELAGVATLYVEAHDERGALLAAAELPLPAVRARGLLARVLTPRVAPGAPLELEVWTARPDRPLAVQIERGGQPLFARLVTADAVPARVALTVPELAAGPAAVRVWQLVPADDPAREDLLQDLRPFDVAASGDLTLLSRVLTPAADGPRELAPEEPLAPGRPLRWEVTTHRRSRPDLPRQVLARVLALPADGDGNDDAPPAPDDDASSVAARQALLAPIEVPWTTLAVLGGRGPTAPEPARGAGFSGWDLLLWGPLAALAALLAAAIGGGAVSFLGPARAAAVGAALLALAGGAWWRAAANAPAVTAHDGQPAAPPATEPRHAAMPSDAAPPLGDDRRSDPPPPPTDAPWPSVRVEWPSAAPATVTHREALGAPGRDPQALALTWEQGLPAGRYLLQAGAIDALGAHGATHRRLDVRPEVALELRAPAWLHAGDRVTLDARVVNRDQRVRTVRLRLSPAPWFAAESLLVHELRLEPGATARPLLHARVIEAAPAARWRLDLTGPGGDVIDLRDLPVRLFAAPAPSSEGSGGAADGIAASSAAADAAPARADGLDGPGGVVTTGPATVLVLDGARFAAVRPALCFTAGFADEWALLAARVERGSECELATAVAALVAAERRLALVSPTDADETATARDALGRRVQELLCFESAPGAFAPWPEAEPTSAASAAVQAALGAIAPRAVIDPALPRRVRAFLDAHGGTDAEGPVSAAPRAPVGAELVEERTEEPRGPPDEARAEHWRARGAWAAGENPRAALRALAALADAGDAAAPVAPGALEVRLNGAVLHRWDGTERPAGGETPITLEPDAFLAHPAWRANDRNILEWTLTGAGNRLGWLWQPRGDFALDAETAAPDALAVAGRPTLTARWERPADAPAAFDEVLALAADGAAPFASAVLATGGGPTLAPQPGERDRVARLPGVQAVEEQSGRLLIHLGDLHAGERRELRVRFRAWAPFEGLSGRAAAWSEARPRGTRLVAAAAPLAVAAGGR